MSQVILVLIVLIYSNFATAKETQIICKNTQNYPSIEITGDESILSQNGHKDAKLKGLIKPVDIETKISPESKSLQMTITSKSKNRTVLIQIRNAEEAFDAWDGAGTLAFGPKQAKESHEKLFGSESTKRVMIVQQYYRHSTYPKTGGFCVLSSN